MKKLYMINALAVLMLILIFNACSLNPAELSFEQTPQRITRFYSADVFPVFTDTYYINPVQMELLPFDDHLDHPLDPKLTARITGIYSENPAVIKEGYKALRVDSINETSPANGRWHGIGYEYNVNSIPSTTNMTAWSTAKLHFWFKSDHPDVYVGIKETTLPATNESWIDMRTLADTSGTPYTNNEQWQRFEINLCDFSIGLTNINMFFMIKATNAPFGAYFAYDAVYWTRF